MLWAYSIIVAISPPDLDVTYKNVTMGNTSFLEETFTPTKSLGCKPFINNKYSPVHSCDMATEALCLGLISLSLTLLNILCIFIMGITFLKVTIYRINLIMTLFNILCIFIMGITFLKVTIYRKYLKVTLLNILCIYLSWESPSSR